MEVPGRIGVRVAKSLRLVPLSRELPEKSFIDSTRNPAPSNPVSIPVVTSVEVARHLDFREFSQAIKPGPVSDRFVPAEQLGRREEQRAGADGCDPGGFTTSLLQESQIRCISKVSIIPAPPPGTNRMSIFGHEAKVSSFLTVARGMWYESSSALSGPATAGQRARHDTQKIFHPGLGTAEQLSKRSERSPGEMGEESYNKGKVQPHERLR